MTVSINDVPMQRIFCISKIHTKTILIQINDSVTTTYKSQMIFILAHAVLTISTTLSV